MMIMSFNSGLRKERQMTKAVSKGHWKLVFFESVAESDVDSMPVRMFMCICYMHLCITYNFSLPN